MNETMKKDRLPGGSRLWKVGGTLLALFAVVGLLFAATRKDAPPPSPEGSDPGEIAGGSMEGMQMSTDGSVHLSAARIREFGVTFGTAEPRLLEG